MEQGQEMLAQVAEQGNYHSSSTAATRAAAMMQFTNNKPAGCDGLAAELFKMGPERLTVEMLYLIVKIWEQEQLPEEFKLDVNHPVYKKGPRSCSPDLRPLLQILLAATKLGLLKAYPPPTKFCSLRQILQKVPLSSILWASPTD